MVLYLGALLNICVCLIVACGWWMAGAVLLLQYWDHALRRIRYIVHLYLSLFLEYGWFVIPKYEEAHLDWTFRKIILFWWIWWAFCVISQKQKLKELNPDNNTFVISGKYLATDLIVPLYPGAGHDDSLCPHGKCCLSCPCGKNNLPSPGFISQIEIWLDLASNLMQDYFIVIILNPVYRYSGRHYGTCSSPCSSTVGWPSGPSKICL